MACPRTRLTDAEWNQHKSYIRRMIIDQNMSQGEVRQRLKDDGVLVTKAQLEYKLKIWGVRKKVPKEKSDAVWQFIGHRVEKRKQQHKASDVFLNGQLVDPEKVRKEINRHIPSHLARINQAGMSPKTPRSMEVSIRTPASTPMQSVWPTCLPWLRFQQRISHTLGLAKPLAVSGNALEFVTEMETTFLPLISRDFQISNEQDSSTMATGLKSILLDAQNTENASCAQLLLGRSAADITTECLKIAIYRISNNLSISNESDEWNDVVKLLEESGITKRPLRLRAMMDTTLNSATETLFQKAFEALMDEYERRGRIGNCSRDKDKDWPEGSMTQESNWKIINWLLSSGQNPNTPVRLQKKGRLTPLQVAVDLNFPRLICLLLDKQSDPTLVYDDTDPPIKRLLRHISSSCNDKIRLVKRFLREVTSESFLEDNQPGSLLAAALQGMEQDGPDTLDLELLDILMGNQWGKYLTYQMSSPLDWAIPTCGILGYAVRLIDESAAMSCVSHLLRRARQSEPTLSMTQFITSDVMFLAASRGHNRILELLRGFNIDLTARGHRGITTLHVAACFGFLETCRKLLELGVPVDGHLDAQHLPTPLHLAAFNSKFETVRLLHSYGADLSKSITPNEDWRWGQIFSHFKWSRACYRQFKHGSASPVGIVILNRNRQAVEFFAQQGVEFPPWAVFYEARGNNPQPRAIQLALNMGADPNWRSQYGWRPLSFVLQHAKLDEDVADASKIAMMLLDAGAVSTVRETTQAILLNDSVLVNRLIESKYLGISQEHEFMAVLEAAIAVGNQHITAQIFNRFPDAYNAGVLCASVFFEDHSLRTVERLLRNRPQLGDALPLESLSIGIAAWRNRADLLDLLLAKFAKPSPAALPCCIFDTEWDGSKTGWISSIDKQLGAARSQRFLFWRETRDHGSPLILAFKSENSLSRLLDHGFLPDRITMSFAAVFGISGPIKILARYPMEPSGFEEDEGPLTTAVSQNDIDLVKYLLSQNHCIDEDNFYVNGGRNPLQMAVECGHMDLVKLLLNAGADVNAPPSPKYGATALQLAAIKGYLGIAKMLVDLGADVNAPAAVRYGNFGRYCRTPPGTIIGYGGYTALEAAAMYGRIDIIQYLLSQGVKTRGNGRPPYLRALKYAERRGHLVAAKLLRTWREWNTKDYAVWANVPNLSVCPNSLFDELSEYQSDSESESETHSPGEVHEYDGMQDLVLNNTPAAEAHTPEISVTANPAGGIISELENLEIMTNDTFEFWCGL